LNYHDRGTAVIWTADPLNVDSHDAHEAIFRIRLA
jgi:hypothetical protein